MNTPIFGFSISPNRVKNETIQKRLTVHIMDQRGGFDEWVNGTERVNRNKRTESEIDTYAILQSLQSSEEGVFPDENSQKARLPLILQRLIRLMRYIHLLFEKHLYLRKQVMKQRLIV